MYYATELHSSWAWDPLLVPTFMRPKEWALSVSIRIPQIWHRQSQLSGPLRNIYALPFQVWTGLSQRSGRGEMGRGSLHWHPWQIWQGVCIWKGSRSTGAHLISCCLDWQASSLSMRSTPQRMEGNDTMLMSVTRPLHIKTCTDMAFASSRQCEKENSLDFLSKMFPPTPDYTNQTNETNPYQTINTADLEFYVNDGKQIAY